MAVARYALTLRSKGQGHGVLKLELYDADTDTDIVASILARM